MDARDVIEHFRDSGEVVRVACEDLESGWVDGYVTACGPEWFVLEVFDEASRLNGFSCMRYQDVTACQLVPHADFRQRALAARQLTRRMDISLDVSSVMNLVRSAGDAFQLVTMHFDDEEPYCYVAKILAVTSDNVRYLYISPGAVWDEEPSTCALDQIVRIDVGGAYEEALFLVGGRN